MLTVDEILAARAGKAYDKDGEKIGVVGEVYLDDTTGAPAWVTVNTGFFGTSESFVPLEGAVVQDEDLHLPYSKAMVKDAPQQESNAHLSPEDEEALYTYYGLLTPVPVVDGEGGEGLGEGTRSRLRLRRHQDEPKGGQQHEVHVIREPLNERVDGVTLSEGGDAGMDHASFSDPTDAADATGSAGPTSVSTETGTSQANA